MRYQIKTLLFSTVYICIVFSCNKPGDTTPPPTKPAIVANPASNITVDKASIGGKVTASGNAAITTVGVCWATTSLPTTDSNKTIAVLGADSSFAVTINGLKSGTLYYARAYAINSVGTSYSNEITFTTPGGLPVVTTDTAILKPADTVFLSGKVNPNYLSTAISFEYGPTTGYGTTVNAIPDQLSGNVSVNVSAGITGLTRNTVYHYRLKAENAKGITYGQDKTFRLPDPDGTTGTVTDVEGNTYTTMVFGNQVWMIQNLKSTKYNDGTSIPNVTDFTQWPNLTTPGYCWYANSETYKNSVGALYNWYAAASPKLAPVGWHVASDNEWKTLITYLGGPAVAAGKLQSNSGFYALAGGARFESGFTDLGFRGFWWTSTPSLSPEYAVYYFIDAGSSAINTSAPINYRVKGFSVRCVKDF